MGLHGQSPTPRAWRWIEGLFVAALAIGALGYATLPQAWAERQQSRDRYPEKVFSGALPTSGHETMTYWSSIRQAPDGSFFFTDLYTPEDHPRTYVNVFFWGLGTAARVTRLSVPDLYVVSRIVLGAALLALLYLLSRRMFSRPGERMTCFFMLVLSGGWEGPANFMERNFGWAHVSSPGWWTPEMSTFFSLMLFPNFVAAFIAMIAIALLMMRAWEHRDESWRKGIRYSVWAGVVLSVLTFFHPYDTVTMVAVMGTAPLLLGLSERRWPWSELLHSAIGCAILLPSLLFNMWLFRTNPVMRAWDLQNLLLTPEPRRLAIAFGVGGLLSVVAIAACRKLNRYQLVMAAWLLSTLAVIHLPLRFQRRMIGGVQFPLAVLATAAIALVIVPAIARWFRTRTSRISVRFGYGTLAMALLLAPLQLATPYYLQGLERSRLAAAEDYSWLDWESWQALQALEAMAPPDSTIISSYEMGTYIPALCGQRCVAGHYALTVDSEHKQACLARFFRDDEDDRWRAEFLNRWSVDYLLFTRHERALGDFDPVSRPWLREVFVAGSDPESRAVIYEVDLQDAFMPAELEAPTDSETRDMQTVASLASPAGRLAADASSRFLLPPGLRPGADMRRKLVPLARRHAQQAEVAVVVD
jgi:hypothetical protein